MKTEAVLTTQMRKSLIADNLLRVQILYYDIISAQEEGIIIRDTLGQSA